MNRIIVISIILCFLYVPYVFSEILVAHVTLTESTIQPVRPSIAGISIHLTFREHWAGKRQEDWVAQFPPPLLRFPAGFHARFYDWETGGYRGFNGRWSVLTRPVDNFFMLAKRYDAEVSYIVNVYNETPQKTGRLARHLKSHGYRVRYWELGNEMAAPSKRKKFPDASTYLEVARAHADEIRAVFPDAEFGITAQDHYRSSNRWNKILAKQDWCKNIIIHRYHGPQRDKRNRLESHGEQISVLKAYHQLLKDSITEPLQYKSIFPGKEFWITEWAPLYLKMDVMNSMAHAIWMARTFLRYLRTPEITMACYWNLNAPPFELIYPVDGRFIHRVPFYVYKMVLDQLRWAKYTAAVQIAARGSPLENFNGQMFEDGNGRRSVFLINASGHEYTVKLPLKSAVVICAEVLGSEDVAATNGLSIALSPSLRNQKDECVVSRKYYITGSMVSLPPFAVAVFEWEEETI